MRIKEAGKRGLKIAQWLEGQEGIRRIYYPGLESDPNHARLKRDFTGCNGILSILLEPSSRDAVVAFLDALKLFPIGSSWGGYESLVQPQYLKKCRTAVPWGQSEDEKGTLLRLQIGFEEVEDLIADLGVGLAAFNAKR